MTDVVTNCFGSGGCSLTVHNTPQTNQNLQVWLITGHGWAKSRQLSCMVYGAWCMVYYAWCAIDYLLSLFVVY